MSDWVTWIGIAVGGGGSLVSMYTRAALAESDKKIAVLEAKLAAFNPQLPSEVAVLHSTVDGVLRQVKDNYDYCHSAAHDTRNVVSMSDLRAQGVENKLGERLAVAEYKLAVILERK